MSASLIDPFRRRISEPFEFNQGQQETLNALLEVFVGPVGSDQVNALIKKFASTHTEEEVRALCGGAPDLLSNALEFLSDTVMNDKREELARLLSLLSTRPGTFVLTGHLAEFKELTLEEREKAILGWKNSYVSLLRMAFKSFSSLCCYPAYMNNTKWWKAMHYELPESRKVEDLPERFPILKDVPDNLHFDAIVVGSGGGGGVVAGQLAKAGKSVLVIEKGQYFHETEFLQQEKQGFHKMYENGGFSPTQTGSVSVIAGSVFGGGTTFSKDLDRVFERIGASTEGINHNGSNQILVDGCKALGYPVANIAQNTNGKPHECNYCFSGCREGIKNGTMNTWLRDALQHGAQFLDKTKVKQVLIENGKAVGVECILNYERVVRIRADQVVVSAGSLQSPGVLLRSGLKNKQIGNNLFLHPCAITFGFFDRKVRTHEGSIMTAVSTVADNTEGDGYGCKLEVPCLHPGSYSGVIPWRGNASHKEFMLRYEYCSPILVLARDKDSKGEVRYDKEGNNIMHYTLSSRDRRSINEGILKSLDILVAAGAREVVTSQYAIEPFKFEPQEESRVDNARYVAWKQTVAKLGFSEDSAGIFSAHQMGTNRMGISPKTSVVKPTGETWEVKELYVADASVFPTSSGVNPMITTETIALHISDCILNGPKSRL
ncbi:hypothetical protein BY458DRAFT_436911 [Sporodiniella umbellata]|nr:hypothetical protein BY458DRAFT_436911 [Sporodiniella umbellata]